MPTITDEQTDDVFRDLQTTALTLSPDGLRRFCDDFMNALVILTDVFANKFPDDFAKWEVGSTAGLAGLVPCGPSVAKRRASGRARVRKTGS